MGPSKPFSVHLYVKKAIVPSDTSAYAPPALRSSPGLTSYLARLTQPTEISEGPQKCDEFSLLLMAHGILKVFQEIPRNITKRGSWTDDSGHLWI